MIFSYQLNWNEFKPHLVSMLSLAQDNSFGEIYESPQDVCEQVYAFVERPLDYNDAMIYLEH